MQLLENLTLTFYLCRVPLLLCHIGNSLSAVFDLSTTYLLHPSCFSHKTKIQIKMQREKTENKGTLKMRTYRRDREGNLCSRNLSGNGHSKIVQNLRACKLSLGHCFAIFLFRSICDTALIYTVYLQSRKMATIKEYVIDKGFGSVYGSKVGLFMWLIAYFNIVLYILVNINHFNFIG